MAKGIDELGGSCIIENVDNKRRDSDYDGYNDYNSVTIEQQQYNNSVTKERME